MDAKLFNPGIFLALGIFWAVVATVIAIPETHAAIYKTTDAQGNVVFTDIPPRDDSKSVELTEGNLYRPPASISTTASSSADPLTQVPEAEDEDLSFAGYDKLAITSPPHDQALRENTGNFNVTVAIDPGLHIEAGHRLRVLVDGKVAGEASGATVPLQNIDRGTHSLVAQVIDDTGTVLVSSSPVVVHLQRYSILNSPAKKPAG